MNKPSTETATTAGERNTSIIPSSTFDDGLPSLVRLFLAHLILRMSYCDHVLSVVRRPSSTLDAPFSLRYQGGHVGLKTRSRGRILEKRKNCVLPRGHIVSPIPM